MQFDSKKTNEAIEYAYKHRKPCLLVVTNQAGRVKGLRSALAEFMDGELISYKNRTPPVSWMSAEVCVKEIEGPDGVVVRLPCSGVREVVSKARQMANPIAALSAALDQMINLANLADDEHATIVIRRSAFEKWERIGKHLKAKDHNDAISMLYDLIMTKVRG